MNQNAAVNLVYTLCLPSSLPELRRFREGAPGILLRVKGRVCFPPDHESLSEFYFNFIWRKKKKSICNQNNKKG